MLDKESVGSKVLALSINSDVKLAFDCSWDKEIESNIIASYENLFPHLNV